MKNHLLKLLATFNYHSWGEFMQSLAPSHKYGLTISCMMFSSAAVSIDKIFGLDAMAFMALGVIFIAELTSGMIAAHIRGEAISSMKLSRFTFKVAYYLVLIFVPYVMGNSFTAHHKDVAAQIFNWLHTFLVIQIVMENLVSILENLAVISGKDKTAWISKIQTYIADFFSK